jgi:hypothetical protein
LTALATSVPCPGNQEPVAGCEGDTNATAEAEVVALADAALLATYPHLEAPEQFRRVIRDFLRLPES